MDSCRSTKKQAPSTRGVGELPYHLECTNSSFSAKGIKQKRHREKQNMSTQKEASTSRVNDFSDNDFAHIITDIRETCGGWNALSNDAIEKRQKERQKIYIERNKLNESDSVDSNLTTSSETTESYKTTLQDSDQDVINEEITSEENTRDSIERYKKNALLIGILRGQTDEYPESEVSLTEPSLEYYDISDEVVDVAEVVSQLNLSVNEDDMRKERICRLIQSEEDQDIYCHPLHTVHKDKSWKNFKLQRKGVESVITSRQFHLSVDDSSFEFEPRVSKT